MENPSSSESAILDEENVTPADTPKKPTAMRVIREFFRMSQPQFAEALGLSLSTVRQNERGETATSEETEQLIQKHFGVDPSAIRDGTEIKMSDGQPLSIAARKAWKASPTDMNIDLIADRAALVVREKVRQWSAAEGGKGEFLQRLFDLANLLGVHDLENRDGYIKIGAPKIHSTSRAWKDIVKDTPIVWDDLVHEERIASIQAEIGPHTVLTITIEDQELCPPFLVQQNGAFQSSIIERCVKRTYTLKGGDGPFRDSMMFSTYKYFNVG